MPLRGHSNLYGLRSVSSPCASIGYPSFREVAWLLSGAHRLAPRMDERRCHPLLFGGATVFAGALIAESLRPGTNIDFPFAVDRLWWIDAGDPKVGQPRTWMVLELEVLDEQVDELTAAVSAALKEIGGWYCDLRSDDESIVVFSGRIFRYPRGDESGRWEVAEYARCVGVPESQIDWPE